MQGYVDTAAALATSAGVFLVVWQIWRGKCHAQTSFEDQLAQEYRQLIAKIPANVFLGRNVSDGQRLDIREQIYNYIDLSNEQVFLRKLGRVSKSTWAYWQEGIEWNLSLEPFAEVWNDVKTSTSDCFKELRLLEQKGFATDPRWWWLSRVKAH